MNFFKLIKKAVCFKNKDEVAAKFREMILIINPYATASLTVSKGSEVVMTGHAGTVWVTAAGCLRDFRVRNGDTVTIPAQGKIVLQSMAEHVPGRVHIAYRPPMGAI